jgi:hypothetical protein
MWSDHKREIESQCQIAALQSMKQNLVEATDMSQFATAGHVCLAAGPRAGVESRQRNRKPEFTFGSWIKAGGLLTLLLTGLLLLSTGASAQEFRATISGTITDPSGAVVPGATIEVKETSTGTLNRTVSDAAGQYVVPFLLPGSYTVKVTAKGFATLTRSNIILQAQDHIVIDLSLIVGNASQTVIVNSTTPLLDTANASVNTVISTSSVADLPLNGRAPSTLAELSAGVITTAAPEQVHPFDNNAGNAWSIGGTPNQVSEVLLDGSPNETLLGALAFSPTQDSVQEVSVQPFASDASFGHTIGGVINMVTKSGTNRLHGTMYEFGQISGIDANLFFNDASFNKGVEKPLPVFHFNQYGLTAGGPVWIPKVYNGKNKMFFFFAWEGLKDSTPASTLLTVPTTTSIAGSPGTGGEANGDFYQILAAGCPNGFASNSATTGAICNIDSSHTATYSDPYQLWNPFLGTLTGGKIVRKTPYFNNQLTAPFDAVGLAYLKLFPAPNATGNSFGQNNYNSNAPSIDNYSEETGRLDYNVSASDHIFLDARHNVRSQIKNNYFGNNTTGTTLTRENWGASIDNVYTINPTTIIDTRVNWMLFDESHGTPAQAYSPTTVGLPSALVSSSYEPELPYANFNAAGSCATNSYECLGDTGSALDPSTSYQIFSDVVKIVGHHTFKVGFDGRQYRLSVQNFGDASGAFTYNTSWTNSGSSGTTSAMGLDLAAMLLGIPSSAEYDQNARADYHQYYVGSFVQDDWRLNPRLTVNLGLRFDINTPFEERLGKTVNGFNPTAAVIYSGTPTWTSYTTAPVNGQTFTVPTINLNGGLTFPSGANGAVFATNSGFFSPRVGFSFEINPKTVLRGGGGVFVQPEGMSNEAATGVTSSNALSNQEGFNAPTSYVTSVGGVVPRDAGSNSPENPFPVLSPAVGSSLGASTYLGAPAAISFLAPSQHDPYSERWNLGVQRSLNNHLMIEAMYVGNHSVHLPVGSHNINAILPQYLSTTPYFNFNMNSAYGTKIANPFLGKLNTQGTTNATGLNTSATESLSNFIVPFPQYGTGTIAEQNMTIGQSWFQSGIVHIEKRASQGLTLTANYSFSKMIEADSFRNDQDSFLERRISPFDHTHHFTAGGSYELPFGRGKQFSFNGSRLWDEIAGGYVINGIYQFQTGAPIYFSADLFLDPSVTSLRQIVSHPRDVSQTQSTAALNVAAFVTTSNPKTCTGTCDGSVNVGGQPFDHYRTLPTTMSWVRMDGYNNLDASILKDFHFTESSYFQLRFETFNTLNHPIFAAPAVSSGSSGTFGIISGTTANSLPRQIQIGGRIVF